MVTDLIFIDILLKKQISESLSFGLSLGGSGRRGSSRRWEEGKTSFYLMGAEE